MRIKYLILITFQYLKYNYVSAVEIQRNQTYKIR